jgi:SAM-dependent methyltransferase
MVSSEQNIPPQVTSQEQFGRQARFYTESIVHSSGESLQVVQDWASRDRYALVGDIGAGTGFTAFTVAPYADLVLAVDITPAMLMETRKQVDQRGLSNLGYVLAASEQLPFQDGSLDLLTCRTAAHHFQDLDKAVSEWHRVIAPEAVLIMADTSCPEDGPTADWMNDIEERRDPSHVLNLSPSEWISLLESKGFLITDTALAPVPMEFDDWVRRSGTPEPVVEGLRRDFLNASPEAVEAFHIRQDDAGSIHFQWTCVVARALRQG